MAPDQGGRARRSPGVRVAASDAGFTLVEMLVALVLLGMVATMMAVGFASGHRLWTSVERQTARGESIEAAQTLLRGRLERLRPFTRSQGRTFYSDVEGRNDRLSFWAEPPDARRPAAVTHYILALDANDDLTLAGALDPQAASDDTLLSHVASLEIGYFGPAGPNDPGEWQDSWSHQAAPPSLIRVRVAFPPGDRRSWPDLLVRPAANVDTACLIDATTGQCGGRS